MNPIEILKENMPFPDDFDMQTGKLEFTINSGYITFKCQNRPEHGKVVSGYVFHPNGVCEGKGICNHCGCTLFD